MGMARGMAQEFCAIPLSGMARGMARAPCAIPRGPFCGGTAGSLSLCRVWRGQLVPYYGADLVPYYGASLVPYYGAAPFYFDDGFGTIPLKKFAAR